jgi:hypothetical protein
MKVNEIEYELEESEDEDILYDLGTNIVKLGSSIIKNI